MADQTRKMSPPKKPVDQRQPITTLGPTPLRMITTYMLNSSARKQFRKDTQEYEQKKAAFEEAMDRLNTQQKQKKAKTTTPDIRKKAMEVAKKRSNPIEKENPFSDGNRNYHDTRKKRKNLLFKK